MYLPSAAHLPQPSGHTQLPPSAPAYTEAYSKVDTHPTPTN